MLVILPVVNDLFSRRSSRALIHEFETGLNNELEIDREVKSSDGRVYDALATRRCEQRASWEHCINNYKAKFLTVNIKGEFVWLEISKAIKHEINIEQSTMAESVRQRMPGGSIKATQGNGAELRTAVHYFGGLQAHCSDRS